jgi:hypothetical protein
MKVAPVVLLPGGLYEDMDAARFWEEPGVISELESHGLEVLLVDRLPRPMSWEQDAAAAAVKIADAGLDGTSVVAGSNGCSTAVRLALDHRHLVSRLILCWPATAGDEHVDVHARRVIASQAGAAVAGRLLSGDTLRGVADAELRRLSVPVLIIPAEPENLTHRRATVSALSNLLPDSFVAPGCPETPRPEFGSFRSAYIETLLGVLA